MIMARSIRSLPLALAALFAAATAAGAVEMPKDMVACERIAAWSTDTDPNGLNMRAAPSIKGKVIGTLKHWPETADEPELYAGVTVLGFHGGWFLVARAAEEGTAADGAAAEGWVHGSKLAGQLFGTYGGFRDTPDPNAKTRPPRLGTEPTVKRLLACRGAMVQVETDVGTGWVEGLCGNQLTTCP